MDSGHIEISGKDRKPIWQAPNEWSPVGVRNSAVVSVNPAAQTPAAQDTVSLSSAALAAMKEATETPSQTAKRELTKATTKL